MLSGRDVLRNRTCTEVQVSAILNDPACILQQLVDLLTGFLLGFHMLLSTQIMKCRPLVVLVI
jgi:hypothetical protein